MHYRPLGRTGLDVSVICLGTMTWGEQNSEADAHRQLDFAVDRGVTFIDTAETYPIPPVAGTSGRTEAYIGSWLKGRPDRDRLIIASKVVGRSDRAYFGRGAETRLDAANIRAAIDGSLKRLQTDLIDLYQLHWPDRRTNFFGQLGYRHDPDDDAIPLEDTLRALDDAVRAGKIRHVGVSNETPWGVMRFVQLAESLGLPRIASIQNPYSLLNRSFEVGLAEVAIREDVGLLAYSPMAMGALSGKYLDGKAPAGARFSLFDRFVRYTTPLAHEITAKYVALARKHGLDPAQMALAYVNSRPFVTATIIGATRMEQLEADIASIDLALDDDIVRGIEAIHEARPNPCP
ncbi:NADP(H)-dependent aldo-keto reductase [Oceanibacterium hippocampi]|uniref:Protein tas n=1 Tax=Oceanibacterium hippocampi TaxID=745714 RepID=A0A1Y5R9F2_9PROT|nr:NADP(H)-dependent aldo-keto reductase [Oceanibacterium hippocampi]SLN12201.1 L-glyceraldehyde 3-phosphate reductase [Oceanibacterium hippocampi]